MRRSKTALLLLDLQNEMVDPKGKIGASGLAAAVAQRRILDNVRKVMAEARRRTMPVVFVRLGFRSDYADALSVAPRIDRLKASGAAILGTWGTEFPAIIAPEPGDLVFTKQCVNPFFNTGLMTWLLQRDIGHVALTGVATNQVVESTARAADDAGFAVTVIEDCCAAANPDWHRFSIENMLPLFGKVVSSAQFSASPG